jgi:trehalose 6-phosphate synthase
VSGAARLIVVSNRLPITVEPAERGWQVQPSCGGLVTALEPVLRDNAGVWVGWTGTEYAREVAELVQKQPMQPYTLVPVFLTPAEKACFYHGCANEIIWPLFHDLQSRCNFDPAYWEVYREANEKFADAVETVARTGDFVWVHDYHLMMLADALRDRQLRLKIGYFQHIPFPPPDIFEKLPWRTEILRGLLQFNTVGFQTVRDRRNFIDCLRRCLRGIHVQRAGTRLLVRVGDQYTTVGAFPISIDYDEFARPAVDPEISGRAEEIQRSLGGRRIILGVDRLDYTKGIPERLLAYRKLLERYPEMQGKVTLIQVVVPSREDIPNYRELKDKIERLVSEINGEYGGPAWMPIHYLHRRLGRRELIAFYRAAHVALVTPLKDGMNLVAKEFCASRVDDAGVLVLSEFAGAATELKCGALLVNPYDAEGVASALYRAVHMSSRAQTERMQSMRRHIEQNHVFQWCKAFCAQAVPLRFSRKVAVPALAPSRPAVPVAAGA